MRRLSPQQAALLRDVMAKHMPEEAVPDMTSGVEHTSADLRAKICSAISDEFVATGRRKDDEPNQRGTLLEELLDRVNPAFDEQ